MTALRTRIGRSLVWLWHRLARGRSGLPPATTELAGDADDRRFADARRRFWAELREGRREAIAATGVDAPRVTR